MMMESNNPPWYWRVWKRIRQEARWLLPGVGIKRWIMVLITGITILSLGLAVAVLDIYRSAPEGFLSQVLAILALQSIDRTLRAAIFFALGGLLIIVGTWGLNQALLKPFMRPGRKIIETVTAYRRKERGPRIVVIGGGNGLASLLRGLKAHSMNLTAVVTVADDGGSSGDLRRNMGILPPGDIRNCLAALSSDEALMTQIFQYRFSTGAGLGGHSLGNLLITALAEITGSFEEGVAESGRVLAVQGRVLPATLHDVRLVANVNLLDKEIQVKGESRIPQADGQVRRVWLEPDNPLAFPPTIQSILNAELIVIGPGSLYTSILPNLLVPDLIDAVRTSRALKFYICNVATQRGETDSYGVMDHLLTIENHIGGRIFNVIICNNNTEGKLPEGVMWVQPEPNLDQEYPIYFADLVDSETPWRHNSEKLAQTVIDLYYERTGPLSNKDESKGESSDNYQTKGMVK